MVRHDPDVASRQTVRSSLASGTAGGGNRENAEEEDRHRFLGVPFVPMIA
jgi:hypothetical protein